MVFTGDNDKEGEEGEEEEEEVVARYDNIKT